MLARVYLSIERSSRFKCLFISFLLLFCFVIAYFICFLFYISLLLKSPILTQFWAHFQANLGSFRQDPLQAQQPRGPAVSSYSPASNSCFVPARPTAGLLPPARSPPAWLPSSHKADIQLFPTPACMQALTTHHLHALQLPSLVISPATPSSYAQALLMRMARPD